MWHARTTTIATLVLAFAGMGCGSDEPRPEQPPAGAAPTQEAPAPTVPAPAAKPVVPAPPSEVMQWTGELPSDFPGDVPRFPGSKVTSAQGTEDLGVAVTFDSPESIADVATFYTESLAAMGWQTQEQEIAEGSMIVAFKEGRTLQAMVHSGGQGTLVDIVIAPEQ